MKPTDSSRSAQSTPTAALTSRKRFRLRRLEERIAPKGKGGPPSRGCLSGDPGPGSSGYSIY